MDILKEMLTATMTLSTTETIMFFVMVASAIALEVWDRLGN